MPSKRTKEQQAAYMREYRARKRAEQVDQIVGREMEAVRVSRETSVEPVKPRSAAAVADELEAKMDEYLSGDIYIGKFHEVFKPKPPFLAAPDDDCVCGHDRHAYHLAGPCSAYIRPKTKCPCSGFMADLGFE